MLTPLCAGERARKALQLQAQPERTKALVLNLVTEAQGTVANESFHRTLNRTLKALGGSRTLETLLVVIAAIVYVYNGMLLDKYGKMFLIELLCSGSEPRCMQGGRALVLQARRLCST